MQFLALLPILASAAAALEAQQPLVAQKHSTISQPLIGFGTWNLKVSAQNTSDVVSLAIQTGYRQVDCAAAYGNEKEVGRGIADGIKKANITRDELWITSKLWNDHHGGPSVVEGAFNQTLSDLGLDYLDLYLMHWPVAPTHDSKNEEEYVQTWKSMIALPKTRVLNIGVCNFSPAQLKTLISETGVKPSAHQLELHPYLQQSAFVAAHKVLGITITAYSPFGNANPTYDPDTDFPPPLLRNEVMLDIAAARNCTTAQVALKWGMGRETSVIPKSTHEQYIVENFEASKCELTYEDLARLRIMGRKFLTRFSNPSERWGVKLFEGLDGV